MSKYHTKNAPHVSHITLRVMDLKRSLLFYKNVIGLQLKEQTDETVVLGNSTMDILTLKQAKERIGHTEGLYHIAFLLPSMKDLGAWYLYQRKQGFDIYGASNHLVSSAFYFNDPDGNGIEVYADTDPSTWQESSMGVRMDTLPLNVRALIQDVTTPNTLNVEPIIGHLHMKTKNVRPQKAFYELLGFETRFDMGHAVFLASQKYHHHIAFNQWNNGQMVPHNETNVDLDRFTIQYQDKATLDKISQGLRNHNITLKEQDDSVIVYDPMGLQVQLIAR